MTHSNLGHTRRHFFGQLGAGAVVLGASSPEALAFPAAPSPLERMRLPV